MRRKWTTVLVAIVLAFGIFACKKSGNNGHNNQPNVTGGVIQMNGGISTTGGGGGGSGGSLKVDWFGSGGVKILKEGHIDTSFPNPNYPEIVYNYGETGMDVESSTSIAVSLNAQGATEADVVANEYHLHYGDNKLWQRNAAGNDDVEVTGLHIAPGATLIVGLNYDSGDNICTDTAEISFSFDVVIEGTLLVRPLTDGIDFTGFPGIACAAGVIDQRHGGDAIENDMGSLSLNTYLHIFIGEEGLIDTSGYNQGSPSVVRGGDGGAIDLNSSGGLFILESKDGLSRGAIKATGGNGPSASGGGNGAVGSDNSGVDIFGYAVKNYGTIDASGGNGSLFGGAGGDIKLSGQTFLFNYDNAVLTSNGGSGDGGGNGGNITVMASDSGLYNAANIFAIGGDGTMDGGDGGEVTFDAGSNGASEVINRAAYIVTDGGDVTGASGDGGDAGDISMKGRGAELNTVGAIFAVGGNATGTGEGGDGGDVSFKLDIGFWNSLAHQDMTIAAHSIILDGGDGYDAGQAGDLSASDSLSTDRSPEDSLIATCWLIGYSGYQGNSFIGIIADGGDGPMGGHGGGVSAVINSAEIAGEKQVVGPIFNNVNIEAYGGVGSDGDGGTGGRVMLQGLFGEDDNFDQNSVVENAGTLHLYGGDSLAGANNGGGAGGVQFVSYYLTKSAGEIIAYGGDCLGAGCTGGSGSFNGIDATVRVEITGPITSNGGNGTMQGGSGAYIDIYGGKKATNSGHLSAIGGNATGAAPSYGGSGGNVFITSAIDLGSTSAGKIEVYPGTGATSDGMMGHIKFDLLDVTPLDGIWH